MIQISGNLDNAPILDLPSSHCSKYARLVAEQIFGLKYNPANAWDLHKVNNSVWFADKDANNLKNVLDQYGLGVEELYNFKNLALLGKKKLNLINEGIIEDMKPHLKPGHVIGTYCFASSYNSSERNYSHIVIYAGKDNIGKDHIFHQFKSEVFSESLEGLMFSQPFNILIPREIISPPNV